VIERGPAWFKTMGTPKVAGPKLFGMSGHLNKPGVYENELGITLQQSIDMAGGMKGGKYKAAICGGISMGVLGPNQARHQARLRRRALSRRVPGSGHRRHDRHERAHRHGAALRNCVRFYAHESCGQCTPCREGSAWMRKILDRILDGGGRASDLEMLLELEKTMGIMPGTTICGLADGTAWATRTFINKYYDEFAAVCPEQPIETVPLTIKRGQLNVLTPMGSNTR
jgi:NADH-quinone oxidoreductase subunit F